MRVVIIVLGLLLFLGARNAHGGMYCGHELITEGMTKLDVLIKCGEPNLKEVVSVNTLGVGQTTTSLSESTSAVEAWFYNCGEYRFNQTLFFDGSTLLMFKAGDYGTGPERCS